MKKLLIEIDDKTYDDYKFGMSVSHLGNKVCDALIDAMEKAKPLTEETDLISRKAVVELFTMKMIYSGKFDGTKVTAVKELLEDINNLPTAAPTKQKGKWDRGYAFPDGEYWKCSECGELIKVKIPMRFCNNCGAEMERDSDA